MATHDRYEQDILNALRGIDRSLKKIADTLVPKNEKKQSDKVYYIAVLISNLTNFILLWIRKHTLCILRVPNAIM